MIVVELISNIPKPFTDPLRQVMEPPMGEGGGGVEGKGGYKECSGPFHFHVTR